MHPIIFTCFTIGLAIAQSTSCIFTGGQNGEYLLNLTGINDRTLVLEKVEYFAYYTPCGNRMNCSQGSVNTVANLVQFKQGQNQCQAYLAVDNHQQPAYYFERGGWNFHYEDGQLCQRTNGTNSPSTTNIWYTCDEEEPSTALFYAMEETQECQFDISIHSPLACVPEDQINANCQWKIANDAGGFYTLDLSSLKGETISVIPSEGNGYEHFYSPCQNALHCQQSSAPVMCMTENHVTGTCDHYLAIWEDGRVQPKYYANDNATLTHWDFLYSNGEKCSHGSISEYTVRYFCDPSVDTFKVLGEVNAGGCEFVVDISTKLACLEKEKIVFSAQKTY